MDSAYIGMIIPWPLGFAPRNWAFCDGSLISISTNTPLFAIIGNRFGGNGQTNFALPNLNGAMPVGARPTDAVTTPGRTLQTVQMQGAVQVANIPQHQHEVSLTVSNLAGTTTVKLGTGTTGGQMLASQGATLTGTAASGNPSAAVYLPPSTKPTNPVELGGVSTSFSDGTATVGASADATAAVSVALTADSLAIPPSLTTNYIICVSGEFPPRN